jgi:hypothetical protein
MIFFKLQKNIGDMMHEMMGKSDSFGTTSLFLRTVNVNNNINFREEKWGKNW